MIPKETIEQIRNKIDIVDVIGQFVDLERRGNNYIAKCPFLGHEDSSPSFSVSQPKQIFKCFGCGKGGNVFTFLVYHQNMSFTEAVKFLGDQVGVKIVFEKSDELIDYLYDLYEKATEVYHDNLRNVQNSYFESRGIKTEIIEKFRLGFAHSFFEKVKDDYPDWVLRASGIFYSDSFMETFEGRYVFPLIDVNGKIVGFGGRRGNGDADYKNSSDSKIYHKAEFLYGLWNAKKSITASGKAIIVEGYFDVLSLVGVGVERVVAVCGSVLTNAQAKLLSRYCKSVDLFFDGDAAGRKAICDSFARLYSNGVDVNIVDCPDGEDPDSLVRKGILKSVNNYNWFDFYLKDWREGKDKLILFVRTIAEKIENADRRRLFFERCAELAEVSSSLLYQKKVNIPKKLPSPLNIIEDNKEVLVLLSGLLKDPTGFDDPFVKGCFEKSIDDESFTKVIDRIKSFDRKEEASLFDGLDKEGSEIMSIVLMVSKSNPGIQYSISLFKKKAFNFEVERILKEIKRKEVGGEDCGELVKQLDMMLLGEEK